MDRATSDALANAALLESACAGDSDALGALFERHRPALETRIKRFLPPAVQRKVSVSDVLQETRILAFERTELFKPRRDGAFRVWLLRIAECKAREALR